MNFTNEQLAKAKAAKSVEELLALAKENGTELTEDEAKKFFAELNKEGEIADDELDNVAGGCGDPDPKYKVGDCVCIGLGGWVIVEVLGYDEDRGYLYRCKSLEPRITADGTKDYLISDCYEDMFCL